MHGELDGAGPAAAGDLDAHGRAPGDAHGGLPLDGGAIRAALLVAHAGDEGAVVLGAHGHLELLLGGVVGRDGLDAPVVVDADVHAPREQDAIAVDAAKDAVRHGERRRVGRARGSGGRGGRCDVGARDRRQGDERGGDRAESVERAEHGGPRGSYGVRRCSGRARGGIPARVRLTIWHDACAAEATRLAR
jgi:hypothetical protein